jgi:uncharacterized protein
MRNSGRSKLDSLCWFISTHRLLVLVFIVLVTGIFLYGTFRIRGEVILQEMLPCDHPYLKIHAQYSEVFGSGGSGVVIAVKAREGDIFRPSILARIKTVTDEVALWDEVYRVLTISMASRQVKVVKTLQKGEINVSSLMWPEVPSDGEQMELLKKHIFTNPAYDGVLVSDDGTAALIFTEFRENISYSRAFSLLQKIRRAYSDGETSIHVVGFPMLMGWIYSLTPQMYMVFGLSIVAIAVVLWMVFLNIPGMISPLVNAGILTVWGLGFIGFSGINFSPLLYVLAFLVGARMIGNSHQIAYRYFEELDASGGDRTKACYETMRTMWIPNFAAVAADVAGFAVLLIVKIVLMYHLAIIMSFWMATILLTGLLVPVVCSVVPLKVESSEWAKETCQRDWKARLMMRISHFSIAPRTRYVAGAVIMLIAVFCVWGMGKLKIGDPTPGSNIFYDNHTYNKDQAIINKLFKASSENLVLYYEGEKMSVYDPVVLNTFDAFARHMRDSLPDIYKSSTSVIDLVKMVNLTFHDGDEAWYQLPATRPLLGSLADYVRGNIADVSSFSRYMDRTQERAQITIFFADHTSKNLLRIRDAAVNFFKDHPMKTGRGQFQLAGGRIGMEIAVNEEMKRTHLLIDLSVYGAIFLLCAICYRSVVAGLMLTVPLVFANAMSFSYMAMRNIGLSINTLPVAAIGAGLGVDFAIYLYSRAIEEFPIQNGDWYNTIMQSVCTCGKAVVYTGITVILPILTWYFFSDMKFQAEVGFFLSLIMAANVILVLTLHPLMIFLIKPKFISRARVAKAT